MAQPVLSVSGLTKQFGSFTAVADLSFEVADGEVYGFLGQNGAGKSTTIRMLLTLIRPTSGSIRMFGKNLFSNRSELLCKVGAVIEKPDLYKYLTAYQNLRMMAQLSGFSPTQKELLHQLGQVGLTGREHDKVKSFSQGMKQRLGLACALIHQPRLIVLDEPVNGLDPQGIADMRNLLLHLSRNENKTVFVSSHLLNEMELIADSMLIIDRGKKVAEGKVSELLHPSHTIVALHTTDDTLALERLQQSAWHKYLQPSDEEIRLRLHRQQVPDLNRDLVAMGIGVLSLQAKHSLEDYFLSLTSENQHVAAYRN